MLCTDIHIFLNIIFIFPAYKEHAQCMLKTWKWLLNFWKKGWWILLNYLIYVCSFLKIKIVSKKLRRANGGLSMETHIWIQKTWTQTTLQGLTESFSQPQTWMKKCYKMAKFQPWKGQIKGKILNDCKVQPQTSPDSNYKPQIYLGVWGAQYAPAILWLSMWRYIKRLQVKRFEMLVKQSK